MPVDDDRDQTVGRPWYPCTCGRVVCMLASVFPFSGCAFAVFPLSVFPLRPLRLLFAFKLPSYDMVVDTGGSGVVGALWNPG